MFSLNKNNPALDINALALDISGKKQGSNNSVEAYENDNTTEDQSWRKGKKKLKKYKF